MNNNNKLNINLLLHSLLVNLFHPAVLGSVIVLLIDQIIENGFYKTYNVPDYVILFSLIVYFSFDFLIAKENNKGPDVRNDYNIVIFISDIIVLISFYMAFKSIGDSGKILYLYCSIFMIFLIYMIRDINRPAKRNSESSIDNKNKKKKKDNYTLMLGIFILSSLIGLYTIELSEIIKDSYYAFYSFGILLGAFFYLKYIQSFIKTKKSDT